MDALCCFSPTLEISNNRIKALLLGQLALSLCCSALFSSIRLKGKPCSKQVLIPTYLSVWLCLPRSYQHLASPRSFYYLRLYSVIYLQQYLAFEGWEAVFKPKPPMAHQFSRVI